MLGILEMGKYPVRLPSVLLSMLGPSLLSIAILDPRPRYSLGHRLCHLCANVLRISSRGIAQSTTSAPSEDQTYGGPSSLFNIGFANFRFFQ